MTTEHSLFELIGTVAGVGALVTLVGLAMAGGAGRALASFARACWRGSRVLSVTALGSFALAVVSLGLQMIDARHVLGVSTWVKPAKFGVSVGMAAPMLALAVGYARDAARAGALRRGARGVRAAELIIAATGSLELVLITLQAARGVPSHFNNATSFDTVLFAIMGTGISLFWLAEGFLTWRLFRTRFAQPALALGFRFGLVATLIGGALGFVMPRPTPAQLAELQAGRPAPLVGAHAVGVPDGGPGLPVAGWSTEGGDLRVPHFIGLHGLQLLPILAWLLIRRRAATRLITFAGTTYLALTLVALIQALRAQPVLNPDALTIVLALTAPLLAAAVAFLHPHLQAPTFPRRVTSPTPS